MATALYRKYRPNNFEDVSGQDHIVRTLKNAIELGKISHAYLFTGLRGVGKTSIARILAKTVNCTDIKDGEACNKCQSCQNFNAGKALDLIEIDAASNRGIDEIRELREKIKFAPNQGKYKVFIIDEVHMLTKEAFNALLKTLEEPPAHAIFILATTENHKVPDTILSRCQRFDFSQMSLNKIVAQLEKIAKEEKFEYDVKALEVIAVESGGSFRDAITLLDQVSSFNKQKISLAEVEAITGRVDLDQVFNLLSFIIKGKTKEALGLVDDFVAKGGDAHQFAKNILEFLREAMVFKATKKSGEKIAKEKVEKIANALSETEVLAYIEAMMNVERQGKFVSIPQLPLEMAIVRLGSFDPGSVQTVVRPKNVIAPNVSGGGAENKKFSDSWEEVLLEVKAINNSVHALLKAAEPEMGDDTLKLSFLYQFHKERIEDTKNKVILEKVLSKVYGRPLKVKCGIKMIEKKKPAQEEVKREDIIAKSLEIFGGEVIG